MVCFTPLKAYRGHGGGVVFSSKEGFGDLPLDLPCGQCIGCRIRRAQDWVVRCVHESSQHETSSFLTLTYDQVNVPSNGSLDHRHFQLFAKRMRKANRPFRYLVAGEYGGQTYRPHYHACVFGQDFSRDRTIWRTQPHILYESPELNELWGLGHCTIGALTPETVGYVAQYTVKKLTGDQAEEAYTRLDLDTGEEYQVKPEYAAMSRRPGIGESWFRRYHTDVFPSDEVIISSGGGFGGLPDQSLRLQARSPSALLRQTPRRRQSRRSPRSQQPTARARPRSSLVGPAPTRQRGHLDRFGLAQAAPALTPD